MDKLKQYREIIKEVLTHHYRLATTQPHATDSSEVSDRLAFDENHDHYLWFRFGWSEKQQIQHILIYISIKNNKVWVETDVTNFGIVDELLAAGIPQNDIVLGFHPPSKRKFAEFAIA